jgi:hypothetical protein
MLSEARKHRSVDRRIGILAATALLCCAVTPQAGAADTPHLAFVHEYIRELGELERIRAGAEVDLKAKGGNVLIDGIHWSTRIQLALRTNIGILGGVHFGHPFEDLVPQIVEFDKQKIELHGRMIAIDTEFISGPRPGVDYGKLGAEMPQLRAQLEVIDQSFVTMSALVFAMLISEQPDDKGHMSRLRITKAERQDLLSQLHTAFGPKLDQKNQPDLVKCRMGAEGVSADG